MSNSGPATGKPHGRRRRRVVRVAAALAAAALAWLIIERFVLDVDRYRPAIIEEMEEALGLPVSIGELDLVLFPTPHLTVRSVFVGEEDFSVRARSVSLRPDLVALIYREIRLSVDVAGLAITLPSDFETLSDKTDSVAAHLRKLEGGEESRFEVLLNRVSTQEAEVFRHGDDVPFAVLSVEGLDISSEVITVSVAATLPQWGPDAAIDGGFAFKREGKGGAFTSVGGTGSLVALQLAEAIPLEGAPEGELRARFTLEGTGPDHAGLQIDGEVQSGAVDALAGSFSSNVWWDEGVLTVNDTEWDAPGLQFRGDATRHRDGRVTVHLGAVSITEKALHALAAMAAVGDFRIQSQAGAAFEAEDFLLSLSAAGKPRFVRGDVSFQGIDLVVDGEQSVAANLRGRLEVEEGLIHLRKLTGDGFVLTGSILPDWDAATVKVDLTGSIDLGRVHLEPFVPGDAVKDLGGTLTFKRISGTFTQERIIPPDLVVEASLAEGSAVIATSEYQDKLHPVTADFVSDGEGIEATVAVLSEQLGSLRAQGRYTFADGRWKGSVSGNVPQVAGRFLGSDSLREDLAPALAQYGDSTLETIVIAPSPERRRVEVRVTREGLPPFNATCAFVETAGEWGMGAIQAETRLAIKHFAAYLPRGLRVQGNTAVTFVRHPAEERWDVRLDLSQCAVAAGEWLEKEPGEGLVVEATGRATPDEWTAEAFTVSCLGERVAFDLTAERPRSRDLRIALAPLAGLLPEDATASGVISGKILFSPFEVDLLFDGVGFALDPDLAIDSMDGGVAYREGKPLFRDLTIRGANSDCTLTASMEGDWWRGRAAGRELDLTAFIALAGAARTFAAEDDPDSLAPAREAPFLGTLDVRVGRVFYNRGHLDDLRGQLLFDAEGIHAREVSMGCYEGSITGSVDIRRVPESASHMEIEATLDGVDMKTVDDLFFEEPRGLAGTLTGAVSFAGPVGSIADTMGGGKGSAHWTALNGTFGKLGMATKLLTVLRTTELISLRLPSLSDDGLVYDRCQGRMTMERGVLEFHETSLESKAYALDVSGTADFAQEITEVKIFFHVLESVTRIAEKVPVLGKIAEQTTKRVGLTIKVSGPPHDPKFSALPGKGIIKVPVEIGEKAIKGAKDVIKKIFK